MPQQHNGQQTQKPINHVGAILQTWKLSGLLSLKVIDNLSFPFSQTQEWKINK